MVAVSVCPHCGEALPSEPEDELAARIRLLEAERMRPLVPEPSDFEKRLW